MDKALVLGTKDCRLESCQDQLSIPSVALRGGQQCRQALWQRPAMIAYTPHQGVQLRGRMSERASQDCFGASPRPATVARVWLWYSNHVSVGPVA